MRERLERFRITYGYWSWLDFFYMSIVFVAVVAAIAAASTLVIYLIIQAPLFVIPILIPFVIATIAWGLSR